MGVTIFFQLPLWLLFDSYHYWHVALHFCRFYFVFSLNSQNLVENLPSVINFFTFYSFRPFFWWNYHIVFFPSSAVFGIYSQHFLFGLCWFLSYNTILFCLLPQVVYKKLKGKKSELSDLHGLHPSLAQGLQKLLDFEGNVEVSECLSDSCWKEGREGGSERVTEKGWEYGRKGYREEQQGVS